MLFGQPKLLSTATPGRRGKDKMPETDEICDLRPAKSLLPLSVSILPRLPTPIPPWVLGQTNYTARVYNPPTLQ